MSDSHQSGKLRRVGREVDAADYWSERGQGYEEGLNSPYHLHRLQMIDALLQDLKPGLALDFGCGDGVLSEFLARRGLTVVGIEPDPKLAESARKRIFKELIIGGVDALEDIETRSVESFLAANVIAYLSDSEEQKFYTEARRILKPCGSLITTHSNELFDLFTMNAYTVEFFERHFKTSVSTLLRSPRDPDRITFNIRENPLNYRFKLASYGFQEIQQEFAHFHSVPPLLDSNSLDIMNKSYPETLGWPESERWKLLFQCSMFGSRAIRIET